MKNIQWKCLALSVLGELAISVAVGGVIYALVIYEFIAVIIAVITVTLVVILFILLINVLYTACIDHRKKNK